MDGILPNSKNMVKKLYLLGGGDFVWELLTWATNEGIKTTAITNQAQAQKQISATGLSFQDSLNQQHIPAVFTDHAEEIKRDDSYTAEECLYISYGAPWILTKDILTNTFHGRLLNIHGTRLPKDRGGNIFTWQILSGLRTGMCLIHQMTEQIDQGPVIAWDEFIYPASCRIPADYISYYESRNLSFLKEFIKKEEFSLAPTFAQPEYLSTYWPRVLANVHGWINWELEATDTEKFICAFDKPYGGARCRWNNQVVIIRDTYSQTSDGKTHPFQHGLVYRNNGKWLNVCTKGGELLICDIRDEKGNDLLSKIKPGDRLYTLPEDIISTFQRVVKQKDGLVTKKIDHHR